MDILEWINKELKPESCNSDRFIYDDMDSQSGHCLPIIYEPFDATKKSHWADRGWMFDYLLSTHGEGKLLMDFGPGDGWPSLIVAPYASKVIGIEGSTRRAQVCMENAARLEISNAEFVYVPQGSPLPFDDNIFDGIMAATSVEQSLDPRSTLKELFRVLKPDGRFRIAYESLEAYRNGHERDIWMHPVDDHKCIMILFDRDIDNECAMQYSVTFTLSAEEIRNIFSAENSLVTFDKITIPLLESIRSSITDCRACRTIHPSGKTLVSWLREIGFGEVIPSHNGSRIAGQLFESLPEESRPGTLTQADEYLKPVIKAVVDMPAPVETDPMITAVKSRT